MLGLSFWSLSAGRVARGRLDARLARSEEELREVRERVAEKLAGVPEADGLSPESLDQRRRAFAGWRERRGRLVEAQRRLSDGLLRAEKTLGTASSTAPGGRAEGDRVDRARVVPRAVEQEISEQRNRDLAPVRLERMVMQ